MKVGVFATRLAGTDGVSLESAKIVGVLERLGHRVAHCAGELDDGARGTVIDGLHLVDPTALEHVDRAFAADAAHDPTLASDIDDHARSLEPELHRFIDEYELDAAIVQNAWAIPMHLSLALALDRVLADRRLPTIGHHHDLWWERERFARCAVQPLLESVFPPTGDHIDHLVINSIAQRELAQRRGIRSTVLPNVFDFSTPPPARDEFNADLRASIGLDDTDTLVLQPTRVIPRKRIELAIELVARLDDPTAVLVIPHEAGDEGDDYLEHLRRLAAARSVRLVHIADSVGPERGVGPIGRTRYSLWDVYAVADFVTYPSAIEGFGNALLETVHAELPALVGRYPVYDADIGPLGFRFVECGEEITDDIVSDVRRLLDDAQLRAETVAHNRTIAAEHFGLDRLERTLAPLLDEVGAPPERIRDPYQPWSDTN